jgi:hypothetical protein
MVRFGWPVKSSKCSEKDLVSPPYREEDHGSPVAFPSTASPDIPTIPTHFLTLPLWRKHQTPQANSPQCLNMSDSENYSDRHHPPQETLDPREKALPPTPIAFNEDASGVHIRRVDSPLSNQSSRQAPQSVVAPATRPSPSRATAALAHASLAIGLPHSMPRASASSSLSDVNSSFIPIPQSDKHPFPTSGVRRTKSFHHPSHGNSKDEGGLLHSVKRSRRSRGISFGPVSGLDPEGKGKGKALEDIPSHVTPPRKSLVRRASFWGRRRDDPAKSAIPTLPSRDSFDHLSPTLPSLPPMSPLHFDAAVSRSSHSSQTEELLPPSPPGLSPRDECRSRPLPPSPSVSSSEMPVRTLRPPACRGRRPSTADSGVDRSRTLSFFETSPATDKSTSRSPLVPSQRPDAATPRQVARPRSQTNPPLLYRLSANLFSFGSSSSSLSASRVIGAPVDSPEPSPRASTSKPPSIKPHDEESPTDYVGRLLGTVSKAEIASVLASRCESLMDLLDSRM